MSRISFADKLYVHKTPSAPDYRYISFAVSLDRITIIEASEKNTRKFVRRVEVRLSKKVSCEL